MNVGVAQAVLDTFPAAVEPHERLLPSEWAEAYRVLSRRQSAFPGPWRNTKAPHLVGIMDACTIPGVEEVVVKKCAQAGVSEAMRNVLGWCADQEPDPFLYVMPTQDAASAIFRKRILPLLQDTPRLASLMTDRSRDIQLKDILLRNGFNLSPGWAGSPQTLATDPRRFVFNDEVDKYPPFSGRESDPISLGYMRTMTYEDRRLILTISTPTTRAGLIHRAFEECEIQLEFRVPCPHCGEYQAMRFDQVKWPEADEPNRKKRAAMIEYKRLAFYECEHCQGRIEDADKPGICRHGRWVTAEQHVGKDGLIVGDMPFGKRIGFHLNCLPVLWVSFSKVAAEFLRAQGDLASLMNFRNSYLGEVFEDKLARTDIETLREKLEEAPPAGVVPRWASALIAGADTQKDHFWYVIRAFGHVMGEDGSLLKRSQLVAHGRLETFVDVRRVCLDSQFPIDGDLGVMMPEVLAIDSGGGVRTETGGNRTHEVYEFALSDPARIWAIKGHGGAKPPTAPIRVSNITYMPSQGNPIKVELRILDTVAFKDEMAADIPKPPDASGWFGLNDGVDETYLRQMTSQQKVQIREGSRLPVERWVPITSGAAEHLWDAENYCRAAAWQKGVFNWPTRAELEAKARAEVAEQSARRVEGEGSEWIPSRSHPWL
jgi:phage terminase large subunit GpA-like protein